ncbi:MAG: hypothetical protein S4CHLAM45_08380 [Chlamydiales bacterium]|nr:hypothetical protein [Chlamydiales bacterium]MCH9620412.1 hypothetical protein [Chlamydiales bacterium]MCH9622942.1 hypothetical protein [Chlamydiales bacterium]
MPIYCRYLLQNYLKVLFLAIFSFIAILLVSRLKEIAQFATLGTPIGKLSLFILYQIPYVLPIAIPVSCLLSAMLLFQKLSQTHELVALRSGGFSLFKVATPLLGASLFLALSTFYLTSEVATTSHLKTRKMVYSLTSVNPLLLLQNAKIAKLKGAYVQMNPIQHGQSVEDLLIAMPGKQMTLFIAKKIEMQEDSLLGSAVSLISTTSGDSFDHLVIENLEKTRSAAVELASFLRTKGWKISHDHLNWRLLQARGRYLKRVEGAKAKKSLLKIKSEIARRFSFALAPFTFTLLGIAFGIEVSRSKSKRGLFIVLLLTSLSLISFFMGKEFDHLTLVSYTFFFLPHLLILFSSLFTLNQIRRGAT